MTLGLLAYSGTFNSSFHFDDEPNIVDNPDIKKSLQILNIRELLHIFSGNRSIGFLSFSVNYRVNGLDVTGYHIVNLSIHILNAIIVYWLMLLTFKTPYFRQFTVHDLPAGRQGSRFTASIALFSALLFISHPVQTQAVTYIVQRFTSLATFFYLLSLVMYIKWRLIGYRSEVIGHGSEPITYYLSPITYYLSPITYYLFSVIFAILAMKTKEIAFTLPAVIAIYESMFFEGKINKRLLYLIPFFFLMLAILLNLLQTDKPIENLLAHLDEKARSETDMSRFDYLFTQFRVIVTYIRLIFFPVNQNFDYDYPVYHSFLNLEVLLSFVSLLLIFCSGVYFYFRSRFTVHYSLFTLHCLRLASFGIFWFFVTLSVESGIIPIADVINEHRGYLPSAGIFISLSAFIFAVYLRFKDRFTPSHKMIFKVLPLLIIILLSNATYARNKVWKNEVSLWSDVVMKSPGKARGFYNLGSAYHDEKKFDKAIENYTMAISLNPKYVKAYTNRGNAYDEKGQPDKAVEDYLKALSIDPHHTDAYFNLGVTYFRKGIFDNAIENFQKACSMGDERGCRALKDTSVTR